MVIGSDEFSNVLILAAKGISEGIARLSCHLIYCLAINRSIEMKAVAVM
jgi:hypothetical protein